MLRHFSDVHVNRKSCRRPVIGLSHATKIVPCKSTVTNAHAKMTSTKARTPNICIFNEQRQRTVPHAPHARLHFGTFLCRYRHDNDVKWPNLRWALEPETFQSRLLIFRRVLPVFGKVVFQVIFILANSKYTKVVCVEKRIEKKRKEKKLWRSAGKLIFVNRGFS